MKKEIALFPLLLLSVYLNAQIPSDVKLFSIVTPTDTIHFVKINADTTHTKPTILFFGGSVPIPLIIEKKNVIQKPFEGVLDYKTISEKYNVIVISMPNTPVFANRSQLNHQRAYVPDTLKPYKYDAQYWQNNYLEKHVERANIVLDFLRKQPWVDKNKIILLGHSQGSHIVLELAKQNQDIYALGYFGGNILGRFAEGILRERNAANVGRIPQDEAQANIEKSYDRWKTICRDTTEFSIEESDAKRTWKSFSKPKIEDLISIKTPVFIAYGTKDVGAQIGDVMPVFLS